VLDADVSETSERSGSAPFIVFELVDGPTLRRRIQDAPIVDHEVAALGARLADTLDHVHRHGVVHRDVKPANILIPAEPGGLRMAKLSDFGTALVVDSTRVTAEGLTVGTANYLSPEQVTSGPVGPASDVYSLGLVLIEALTGTPAYGGPGLEAALARLARPPVVPSGLEPSFGAVLAAMTARDPAARITAREATRRLTGIVEPSLASDILALGTPCAERHRGRHQSPARRPLLSVRTTVRRPRSIGA
jgi:serine/threonine protein kinase